jgi:hypothetical protein
MPNRQARARLHHPIILRAGKLDDGCFKFTIIIAPVNLQRVARQSYASDCFFRAGRWRFWIKHRTSQSERKCTMKAGVVYPQIELGGDAGAIKAFAQAAEGLGYDHIVIYDHVLGAEHAGREPKLTGPYIRKPIRSTSRWSPTPTSPASPKNSNW